MRLARRDAKVGRTLGWLVEPHRTYVTYVTYTTHVTYTTYKEMRAVACLCARTGGRIPVKGSPIIQRETAVRTANCALSARLARLGFALKPVKGVICCPSF